MNAWILVGLFLLCGGLFAELIWTLLSWSEARRELDQKIKALESPEGRETDPLRKLLADPLAYGKVSEARKAQIEREFVESQKNLFTEERRNSGDE